MRAQTRGFLLVATLQKKYLKSAIFLADSIKDYYPDCSITLYTEAEWIRDVPDNNLFDEVIYDNFNHHRTKLFALSNAPYDLTCYLDVDMYCVHEDISKIWEQATETGDIFITKIRSYNGAISKFPGGELTHHCGMFLFKRNERVLKFMEDWWNLFNKQMSGEWKWDTNLYPEKLRPWDQWSFWWLLNKTNHNINVEFFEDDARWNFVTGYKDDECKGEIILKHDRLVDV